MMLIHADQDRALDYLSTCIDQVHTFGDILQLVIVELIYKVCHANPSERARFIRCIYNLLQSSSPAVKYEAAGTLVTLSSAPTAIKVNPQSMNLRGYIWAFALLSCLLFQVNDDVNGARTLPQMQLSKAH
ncbi:coatomer subunit beta-like [Pyxicephalus adspersus]|uniref:coatomer subunit beta-like n=1 Tax=Pyxicephalus adspersus TaxID=30357 RepID=UPI003B5D0202